MLSECDRIGAVGEGAVLTPADVNILNGLGAGGVTDASVAAAFCHAVEISCQKHDNETILGEPAIMAVLTAMDAHAADPSVQRNGCGALWGMNCVDVFLPISVAAGAVDRLVRAFSVLADDALGMHRAIGAVAVLTTEATIKFILDAGWLGRVLTFMQEQQTDGDYQFVCCMALYWMAMQPVGKAAVLADARSIPYLQRARDNHLGHAETQQHSKLALDKLAA